MSYKISPEASIGHVHLTVKDLEKSLAFYQDLLGFEITTWYGNSAVFLSAGGYHHHIGLNTWPVHLKIFGKQSIRSKGPQITGSQSQSILQILTGTELNFMSTALFMTGPEMRKVTWKW